MNDHAQQYLDLLNQLLFARTFSVSGAELSHEEEDIYLGQLDVLWYQMSPEEIKEVEEHLDANPPEPQ